MTVPVTPGGTRSEVSRTSPAFSPKIARSSRSSGESWVSPFGVNSCDEAGLYRLPTAWTGWFEIFVEVEGYAQVEAPLEVFNDDTLTTVVVQMQSGVTVSGMVVDPDGLPISGATVIALEGSTPHFERAAPGLFGVGEQQVTDADGRFSFDDLNQASYELQASHDEWTDSEIIGTDLSAASPPNDLVIRLRRGGAVRGQVEGADAGGSGPFAVFVSCPEQFVFRDTTTDPEGGFFADRLAPGTYQVTAAPPAKVGGGAEDDEQSMRDAMIRMRIATVEVVEGETVEVVLGAPSDAPVVLRGLVTRAGQPVENGMVIVLREDTSHAPVAAAELDPQGRYEVKVAGPGRVTLMFQRDANQEFSHTLGVTIPVVEEWQYDFEVPSGVIRGRVHLRNDPPPTPLSVQLMPRSGTPGLSVLGLGPVVRVDEDGRFRFDDLAAGTYDLRVAEERFGSGGSAKVATELRFGLELERDDAHLDVDVALRSGGELTGVVSDSSGRPVGAAAIYVRDALGRPLAWQSHTSTDANGRFRMSGLPTGDLFVEARTESGTTTSQPVSIAESKPAEVELRLIDGTRLRVRLADAEGRPSRAWLSVTDEASREYVGLHSMAQLQSLLTTGFDPTAPRIGPLPPGEYLLVATDAEGRREERQLTLDGQPEQRIEVRFGAD